MNGPNKQKVSILRERVPIGLSHGLTLLEKTNGDIDAAEILFKEEVLQIIISSTGVAPDIAQQHLINNNYDIPATLKSVDEERFTLTELIYRRYKNKEAALEQVMHAVEERHHIIRNGSWFEFKAYRDLPEEIFCLLAIMEWLSFEDYEGLDYALSFQLDIVTDQIENVLKLDSLANSLRQARDLQESLYNEREVKAAFENYIKATNELRRIDAYQKLENDYRDQKNLLIERLYDFVKVNINKFP